MENMIGLFRDKFSADKLFFEKNFRQLFKISSYQNFIVDFQHIRDVGSIIKVGGGYILRDILSECVEVRLSIYSGGLSTATQVGGLGACSPGDVENLLKSLETGILLLIFAFAKFSRRATNLYENGRFA